MTGPELQRVLEHRLNQGILAYLGRTSRGPVIALPESHTDPYMHAGSHPDVVCRVWDRLGASASNTQRCLVHGTPTLVLFGNGLVVAVALGTSYSLRLAPPALREALRAGAETEHNFTTVGVILNLPVTFGEDWVFGTWHKSESNWFASSCALLAAA